MGNCDWESAYGDLADLEAVTAEADEITRSLRRERPQSAIKDEQEWTDDNVSDSSSTRSHGGLSDIIEEMKICTECLVDLLPSLENPAKDVEVPREAVYPIIQASTSSTETGNPFILVMRDRFPLAENRLVHLLGDAIWRRRQRLRLNQKVRKEIENFAATKEENLSNPLDERDSSRDSEYSESEMSVGQQSRTTRSSNTAPSVFDHDYRQPTQVHSSVVHKIIQSSIDDFEALDGVTKFGRLRRRDSISSFRSSLATNVSKSGQRRVPAKPDAGRHGAKFECFICLESVSDLRSEEQWR